MSTELLLSMNPLSGSLYEQVTRQFPDIELEESELRLLQLDAMAIDRLRVGRYVSPSQIHRADQKVTDQVGKIVSAALKRNCPSANA